MRNILFILTFVLGSVCYGQGPGVIGPVASSGGSSTLLNDLLAYWMLDDPSGTTLTDAHASYDGTLDGAAALNITGHINTCVEGGASGDGVYLPSGLGTAITGGTFSVSMWVYLDNLSNTLGRQQDFFYISDASTSNAFYMRQLFIGTERMEFKMYNTDNQDPGVYTSIGAMTTASWIHIVVVCPGSGTGNRLKIYIGGSLDATDGADITSTMVTTGSSLGIGNSGDFGSRGVDGKYDEVGIWNRVLTVDEITSLYNSGSGLSYSNF